MLVLGRNESSWGTGVGDVPPSLSAGRGNGTWNGNGTSAGLGSREVSMELLRARAGVGSVEGLGL